MDPPILSFETQYDRLVESMADYLEVVHRLQRCEEDVKRLEKNLFAAAMRLIREINIQQYLLDGRSVRPSQADIENQWKKVEDAVTERNDREIEAVSAFKLELDLELQKANGLQHFKNCYESLKGALDSAESSVETERRRLQMLLGAIFDRADLAQDFKSSPPIYEDVRPHGRADVVLSQDSTGTFYVPPAASLSESPINTVVLLPQEGPLHAVSAPPAAAAASEDLTDTVHPFRASYRHCLYSTLCSLRASYR